MAMDSMLGGGLLGFRQGQQAQDNRQAQFAQLGGLTSGNTITTTTASSNTIWIDSNPTRVSDITTKPRTLREELQAEVDEWLPQLAA